MWKWAPDGNPVERNLKLQAEYFQRRENGLFNGFDYRGRQSGWYAQAVYQFMPQWRVGLRHDQLDSGSVNYGANAAELANTRYSPKRDSVMVDWSASEFSRIRVQLSNDRARQGVKDTQLFVQYQMSLGAHGAHSY